ncbi:Putative bifunctional amine oxidase [Cladobotryum mycophilum]|uniref:Bifunctional amine oxidase n=1 Tax=Cladobotryum mycophilum TaxID=491253 RepID=A0ABR0SG93_9HYPO
MDSGSKLAAPGSTSFHLIRDFWAKAHAIKSIKAECEAFSKGGQPFAPDSVLHNLPDIPLLKNKSPMDLPEEVGGHRFLSVHIGIVGAGVAGLFTAMVLEHLNARLRNHEGSAKLKFTYDILEANSEERLGGRLFTYRFSDEKTSEDPHDYFDVGAMRFPNNPIMKRAFELFDKLEMRDRGNGLLIPYYMNNGGPDAPNLSHEDLKGLHTTDQNNDPFRLLVEEIPQTIRKKSPGTVFDEAIEPLTAALKRDFESDGEAVGSKGWSLLMKYDSLSTRQFLSGNYKKPNQDQVPSPSYNPHTIQWLETFNAGTDMFDQALSETVLDALDFDWSPKTEWFCIEGGSKQLANRMAIKAKGRRMEVDLDIDTPSGRQTKSYQVVFNTTTLGCLGHMDISQANLGYRKKHAIRALQYGDSAKIAIKFKRAWWIHDLKKFNSRNITRGGCGHSDLNIRTCVYPSYNIHDPEGKSAVLLISYTWQQDAKRISSLISQNPDPVKMAAEEARLKDLVLRELAHLHRSEEDPEKSEKELFEHISNNYVAHYAFDWNADPTTVGAFAFFRPDQFPTLWKDLVKPTGDVVIVGEAASPHHAWVVGSIESVIHGLYGWLAKNSDICPQFKSAMNILKSREVGNPFVGLPHYMTENIAAAQAYFSNLHYYKRNNVDLDEDRIADDIEDIVRAFQGAT